MSSKTDQIFSSNNSLKRSASSPLMNNLTSDDENIGDNDDDSVDSSDEIENILQTFGKNDFSTSSIDYYDSRRYEIIFELTNIEKQFDELKNLLYEESILLIDRKLIAIQNGEAPEYQDELKKLYDDMKIQLEIAKQRRQIELQALENVTQSELLSLEQTFENDKLLLYEEMRTEIEDQITELETLKQQTQLCTHILQELLSNERHSSSISSAKRRFDSSNSMKINHKKRRLNPSMKHVDKDSLAMFYQLSDVNILEDWAIIQSSLQDSSSIDSDQSDKLSNNDEDSESEPNQLVFMSNSDYLHEEQI